MSRTLRPALPSLPLPLGPSGLSCLTARLRRARRPPSPMKRARRPPAHPSSHTSTWREVALGAMSASGPAADVDVVGVALLAAEARRRRFIVTREKAHFIRRACPLLRSRVHTLEKELRHIVRSVERCKLVAIAKRRLAAASKATSRSALPVSALLNEEPA